MAAIDVVDRYLATLPGGTRRLAHAEWGVTLRPESAGGHPLEMSVRIDDGLVPAQEGLDPWVLLHWNRQTRLVRMACARSGDIWVHGDVPVAGTDEQAVDRLLGLVVEGAIAVRSYAARTSGS